MEPSAVMKVAPHFARKPRARTDPLDAGLTGDIVDRGEERFAEVKAREPIPFEDDHPPAGPGQTTGGRGAGGASAEDCHVERVSQGRHSSLLPRGHDHQRDLHTLPR
jgi:hypothetical protein